jgi:hypothetical protein
MDDFLFLYGRKFLTEILQAKTQERITAAKSSYQLAARQLKEFSSLASDRQRRSSRKMCFTQRSISAIAAKSCFRTKRNSGVGLK